VVIGFEKNNSFQDRCKVLIFIALFFSVELGLRWRQKGLKFDILSSREP
jgi:hypothetical protein